MKQDKIIKVKDINKAFSKNLGDLSKFPKIFIICKTKD